MTIDAARAGLEIEEVELDLDHRATGRDARGFAHRGRQLADAVLACGPLAVNHRGLRLPLVGWTLALRRDPAVAAVAAIGLADDLWSGPGARLPRPPPRGPHDRRAQARRDPARRPRRDPPRPGRRPRRPRGQLLNQLDTRPGRALKAYLLAAMPLGAPLRAAVILAPYDLREMAMLGDAGSNALGALLGLRSVDRLSPRAVWIACGALAGLTFLGERRSLGALIERTPVLRELDAWGRA